jgi:antitoxin (DNA-binding transcriptional repressor) of toxin-antitoxin stability system
MPVADIVPHEPQRSPWIPSQRLRALVNEAGADKALLSDLADVRESLVEEP